MKVLILKDVHLVDSVEDDSYILPEEVTHLTVIDWNGATPNVGEIFKDGTFMSTWTAVPIERRTSTLRTKRDSLLPPMDSLVTRHRDQIDASQATTLTTEQYQELLTYRQALRDFPENVDLNVDSFDDIVWPTPPSFLTPGV